jgi:hypothetical protein
MSNEETSRGLPPSIAGHHAPEALDQELGTAEKDMIGADMRKAMGERKRTAEWEEVHDAFDTRTADVDQRATGDPLGTPPDGYRTGPTTVPEEQ